MEVKQVMQVMQVMQIMQVMQVMQVMQAVKLVSESIRHWVFLDLTNYNCYRCINSTQWLLFICSQRFTFEWQCLFPPCRLCKPNHSIKVLTVCVIPNQIILHTCNFYSVAPCLKRCQTKPNVPPCRLCKLNDSINMFYVSIPNQIILHTYYSSHSNQIILHTCYFHSANSSAHVLFFTL